MESPSLQEAALGLRDYLNRYCRGLEFLTGVSEDSILIYVHEKARSWRAPTPKEWEGFPVRWKFGIGPIVPLDFSQTDTQPSEPNK